MLRTGRNNALLRPCSVVRFGALRPDCLMLWLPGRDLEQIPPHYNCICVAEACRCTSELGMLKGRRLISKISCVVLYLWNKNCTANSPQACSIFGFNIILRFSFKRLRCKISNHFNHNELAKMSVIMDNQLKLEIYTVQALLLKTYSQKTDKSQVGCSGK